MKNVNCAPRSMNIYRFLRFGFYSIYWHVFLFGYLQLAGAGMMTTAGDENHSSVSGDADDSWHITAQTLAKATIFVLISLIWTRSSISHIIWYNYLISIAVTLLKERSDKWHEQPLDCLSGLVPLMRADWMCFVKIAFSTLFFQVNKSCN